MNSLGNNSIPDLLINDHTNSSRINVEHSTASTMIVLVWHALVNGAIDYDIYEISNFIRSESSRDMNSTSLLESFSELMSSFSALTVTMSHS